MDQHEAAAAEVAGARQRHREREADRDRGVDRVAAEPQHVETDPRGGRLLADHHSMRRDDRPGGCEIGDERRGVGAGDRRSKEKREGEAERSQGSFLRIGE